MKAHQKCLQITNIYYVCIIVQKDTYQTQELLELTTVNTAEEKRERVLCRALIVSVIFIWASLVAQMVKNLPAMQEPRVQSPGQEDSLEKEMATHSSIIAWRMPWTEEPGELQSMGLQRDGHD